MNIDEPTVSLLIRSDEKLNFCIFEDDLKMYSIDIRYDGLNDYVDK